MRSVMVKMAGSGRQAIKAITFVSRSSGPTIPLLCMSRSVMRRRASTFVNKDSRLFSSVQGELPLPTIQNMQRDAEAGDVTCQYHVGLACLEGKHGFKKDQGAALAWFKKSADGGNAQAQFKVGDMFLRGEGCAYDAYEAAKYFSMASDQGVAAAQVNLGLCYERGHGVDQSYEDARKQYALAAAQEDMEAQFNLAKMYISGKGVEVDYAMACELLRMPANKACIPEAQFALGYFLMHAVGVQASPMEGERLMKEAAHQGMTKAQHHLGMCLLKGTNIKKDEARGVDWLQTAAMAGYAPAQYDLFETLHKGSGMEAEALKWLTAAAKGGHAVAELRYGQVLKNGEFGVPKDVASAEKWINKAVAQGIPLDACDRGDAKESPSR